MTFLVEKAALLEKNFFNKFSWLEKIVYICTRKFLNKQCHSFVVKMFF